MEARTGPAQTQLTTSPMPQSVQKPSVCDPAFQRVVQRKVVYYSDFDVDVNDWKSEQQAIEMYAKFLMTNLSKFTSSEYA